MRESLTQEIAMARFANVAFSDGSLLHGFNQRFAKRQPLAAPNDVEAVFRYTPKNLVSCACCLAYSGDNRDIFFPEVKRKTTPDYFL